MNDLVRTLRGLERRLEQTTVGETPGNLTAGSVVFVSATKSFTQNNANLFWDDTNNRLGIGTNAPAYPLDLVGNMQITTNSLTRLFLKTTSSTTKRTEIIFSQSGTSLYELGVDVGGNNSQDFFLYDDVAGATRLYINSSGEVLPGGAGTQNLGNASLYWNDVSYKTLTDRGCVPHQDRWLMPNGQEMSNLEVICALKSHPTEKTIHGAVKLDYASVPVLAQRPAPIAEDDVYEDVVISEADPKRGKERKTERRLKWRKDEKMGADGVEMTLMNGVTFGSIRELKEMLDQVVIRLDKLEKQHGTANQHG